LPERPASATYPNLWQAPRSGDSVNSAFAKKTAASSLSPTCRASPTSNCARFSGFLSERPRRGSSLRWRVCLKLWYYKPSCEVQTMPTNGEWYVEADGCRDGPLTDEQFAELIQAHHLRPTDRVRGPGSRSGNWPARSSTYLRTVTHPQRMRRRRTRGRILSLRQIQRPRLLLLNRGRRAGAISPDTGEASCRCRLAIGSTPSCSRWR